MRTRRLVSSQNSQESDGINLTPLLDVVFVVLIMFILITPMLELDRVELATSSKDKTKEAKVVQENHRIMIHVHADNSIWISSRKVSLEDLALFLQKTNKDYPGQIPQLFQDKKAYFGTYQSIKNLVESCGFEELDVILQP